MSRIDEIKKEIAELEREMRSIQDECSHPSACKHERLRRPRSRMNYDTQEYETDGVDVFYTCSLCEKEWTEFIKE